MERALISEEAAGGPPPAEHQIKITQLFAQYAWAIDSGDADTLVRLFTPDAVVLDPLFGRYEGSDELRTWLLRVWSHPTFPGRQHWVGHKDMRGSASRCTVNSFCIAAVRSSTGAANPYLIAAYTDTVVQSDEQWLFAERNIKFWSRGARG